MLTKVFRDVRIVLENEVIFGDLEISDGRIRRIKRKKGDASLSPIVAPGVIDLHTHGSGGYDFMDGEVEDIEEVAKSIMTHGVTTMLPTSTTTSEDDLYRFLDNFKKVNGKSLPHMPGVHLEGPYLSYGERGAQDPRFLKKPQKDDYMRTLERAEGNIMRWTIAPELEGALDMIASLRDSGILISLGHTEADYDTVSEAYDKGARLLTHFYSSMSSIKRVGGFRVLGAVEAGYLIDGLSLELIADGKHLPPELLRLIFKSKDSSKIVSCTDSMRGGAMGEGPSVLGPKNSGVACIIEDGIAKMPDRLSFAGSVATGETIIKTLCHEARLTLEEVFRVSSLQPAALVGIDRETGSIGEGKVADLVVLDESLNVDSVFISGEETYRRGV